MSESKPPAPSNFKFKLVTALAIGLLVYIGACGARMSLHLQDDQGIYLPNSLIFVTTGIFMLIVVAIWLVLRAILRKDKP